MLPAEVHAPNLMIIWLYYVKRISIVNRKKIIIWSRWVIIIIFFVDSWPFQVAPLPYPWSIVFPFWLTGKNEKKTYDFTRRKSYLLQAKLDELGLQVPFHLAGGGPSPSSLKLADSGHIPVSITPTIMSVSAVFCLLTCWVKFRKSHDLVVWSVNFTFGNTETTPSIPTVTRMQEQSIYVEMNQLVSILDHSLGYMPDIGGQKKKENLTLPANFCTSWSFSLATKPWKLLL